MRSRSPLASFLIAVVFVSGCSQPEQAQPAAGTPPPPPSFDPLALGATAQVRLGMGIYTLDARAFRVGSTIRIEPRIAVRPDGLSTDYAPGSLLIIERLWAANGGPAYDTTQVPTVGPAEPAPPSPAPRIYRHEALLDWPAPTLDLVVQIHDAGDAAGAHPRLYVLDVPIVPVARH